MHFKSSILGAGFFTAPSSLRAPFKGQECEIKCFYPCLNNNKTEVCLHVWSEISVYKSTAEGEGGLSLAARAGAYSDPLNTPHGIWGEKSHEAQSRAMGTLGKQRVKT